MVFRIRLLIVSIAVLLMFILHNSFWLWPYDDVIPLLFGFMPFSFSYYVGYALLSVVVMLFVIKFVWPDPPPHVLAPENQEENID